MKSRPNSVKVSAHALRIVSMSWRDFERLICDAFRRRGFKVTGFGVRAAAGRADLALTRGEERFLVQCKHWTKPEIGVSLVRELNGAVSAVGAHGGFVITAGEFAPEARDFARHTVIELIDGHSLADWISPAALAKIA